MKHGNQKVSLRQFTAYVGVFPQFAVDYSKYIYGNVLEVRSVNLFRPLHIPDDWLQQGIVPFLNQHQIIMIILFSALNWNSLWKKKS